MNIKDYLHLYLGCKTAVKDEGYKGDSLKLIGICDMGCQLIDEAIKLMFYVNEEHVKPILRPLSDMSDEEAKELLDGANCKYDTIILPSQNTKKELIIVDKSKMFKIRFETLHAEAFRFLLSKHFDLFSLIDAGLAVDKTKSLKQ